MALQYLCNDMIMSIYQLCSAAVPADMSWSLLFSAEGPLNVGGQERGHHLHPHVEPGAQEVGCRRQCAVLFH
jgi:hypothetical protein